MFQRSVTSVSRCRVIRRVTSAAWTVRGRTPVCVNRAGRVSAVTRVRECLSHLTHHYQFIFSHLPTHFLTDINECEDPEFPAGCNQMCYNLPGSFVCSCEKGFYTHDNIHCIGEHHCTGHRSQVTGQRSAML